jgi:hypothetical protein
MGLSIHGQNRFHARAKARGQFGNTPLTGLPGFEMFFCNSKRTVSTEMRSTPPTAMNCLVNNSSAQRSRPSGGALQAKATRWTSCYSLSNGSRSAAGLSSNAASIPASQNRKRIRRVVDSLMYSPGWNERGRYDGEYFDLFTLLALDTKEPAKVFKGTAENGRYASGTHELPTISQYDMITKK